MFNQIDEMDLTKKLLFAVGLEIDPNTNNVIDQDTRNQISFEGKNLKANTDPNKTLYISKYDIKLSPADPKSTKIIEKLFAYFLDKNTEEGNINEVKVYYFDKDTENNKYRLNIKFSDGVRTEGSWFNNKIFCFIESMFQIDGAFMYENLNPFDIIYDDEEFDNDD